jgi:ADP-ribosylglycohydrolase
MNHEWSYPLQSILDTPYSDSLPHGIKSSGYVVDTLQSALWAVENSNSFEDAVLKAVNLGDDADTVGAVAGQIAGAIYGYAKVPDKFKNGLAKERQLYVTSQFLS